MSTTVVISDDDGAIKCIGLYLIKTKGTNVCINNYYVTQGGCSGQDLYIISNGAWCYRSIMALPFSTSEIYTTNSTRQLRLKVKI